MTTPLEALSRKLPQAFHTNAQEVRRLAGSDAAAAVWEEAARLASTAIREAILTPLPLEQAAAESGYTASHLQRLVREGTLPNSGTESEVRILRRHLPRKPGHGVDGTLARSASSPMQAARADMHGDA